MREIIKILRRDTRGATAVEYGLIVALIAVAAIASMQTLGLSLTDFYTFVNDKLDTAEETASE
ncbi:MAG: Flp family type IVb pilin [Alphaproteobacteria bacterium]